MKIISKEKYWFGYDRNFKVYCFEKRNDNYYYSLYNNYEILSDITINDDNQVNSFNDQPLIYKDVKNRLCKEWFINGENDRSNPEKPYKIIKGLCYHFNHGKSIYKKNLK